MQARLGPRTYTSQPSGICGVSTEPLCTWRTLSSSFKTHAFPGSCLNEYDYSNGPFLVVSGMVVHDGDSGEPGIAPLTPKCCCWSRPCSHGAWGCLWGCVCGASRGRISPESHVYPYMVCAGCSTCAPWYQWLSGSFISHSSDLLNTHGTLDVVLCAQYHIWRTVCPHQEHVR